ncbi:hypothetical protein EV359DRAFT_84369 [Lentinula novae-zelandiae]|nr:hypothetical protein EV359DRAFT_84369 [Lentinula novae-zelandiae]
MVTYAKAHVRAFTESNIKAAFSRTGIVPFNPNVVSEQAMAPSLETSTSTTRLMPLGVASPVKEISMLISAHQQLKQKAAKMDNSLNDSEPHTPTASPSRRARMTSVANSLSRLSSTSALFLVSSSPIRSTSHLPQLTTTLISPPRNRDAQLLAHKPKTEYEARLQVALLRSNNQINLQNETLRAMQAQNILQNWYAKEIRGQLEYKEEKANTKKSTRLHVDGCAKLLTSDKFTTLVEQASTKKAKEAAELSRKRDARSVEGKNEQILAEWEASVQEWEVERDLARTERRKAAWTKPLKPTYASGMLLKPPPKPKLSDFLSTQRIAPSNNWNSTTKSTEDGSNAESDKGSDGKEDTDEGSGSDAEGDGSDA